MFLVYSRNKSTTAMPELIFYVTCFYFFAFVFSLCVTLRPFLLGRLMLRCPNTMADTCPWAAGVENVLIRIHGQITVKDNQSRKICLCA